MYADVEFLTSLNPPRSYEHPASLEKSASYIDTAFASAGYQPGIQTWTVQEREYKNVIASYNNNKSSKLILGAHYDVCGDQPGADDNASGVAGLLELARLLAIHQPAIDYGIDLVAYCLEEPPFFASHAMGSYIHAKSIYETKTKVIGMISLEMIGYFSDLPESQPFPSPELAKRYPHTANFIIVVGINRYKSFNNKIYQLMSENPAMDVQMIDFPEEDGLAGLSDQRNYWKFGYPALMVNDTSFLRNPNYHSRSDTIDTLNFEKMTQVVNSVYRAITKY
jgi:hypothetical protein